MSGLPPFTIVDVETTGLFAGASDRVIEIGLVRVSPTGQIQETYTTLVNPDRDIGPIHVHGLTTADVLKAPFFKDVAGAFCDFVRGSFLVAHNAVFDRRFIEQEFRRSALNCPRVPWLCTLRLCSRFTDVGGRSLQDCCDYFEVELSGAHSALNDALATAEVLKKLIELIGARELLNGDGFNSEVDDIFTWPVIDCLVDPYPRSEANAGNREEGLFIKKLLGFLPAGDFHEPAEQQYLQLLDRVLEDRRVTEDEFKELLEVAAELSLSKGQVEGIHAVYMKDLLLSAWADHVITDAESADLECVRKLLCIDPAIYDEYFEWAREVNQSGTEVKAKLEAENLAGKSVCFTGEFQCVVEGARVTRELACEIAERLGLQVKKGVTKKLDMLVTADPDSLSGKAKKARDYGVRILAEQAFWKKLGMQID